MSIINYVTPKTVLEMELGSFQSIIEHLLITTSNFKEINIDSFFGYQ